MPVDKGAQLIVEDILKEAEGKSTKIIKNAKREAKSLLDAASFNVKEKQESEISEARVQSRRVYDQMLAEGRMRAKRETLQRREELINEVIKKVENKLQAYAKSEKYKKDLIYMTVEACKKIGSDKVVIQANRRDLGILTKTKIGTKPDENKEVTFGDPIQTTGGVKVRTSDGKIEVDETFEGRMRREFGALRIKIAKILFEGSK